MAFVRFLLRLFCLGHTVRIHHGFVLRWFRVCIVGDFTAEATPARRCNVGSGPLTLSEVFASSTLPCDIVSVRLPTAQVWPSPSHIVDFVSVAEREVVHFMVHMCGVAVACFSCAQIFCSRIVSRRARACARVCVCVCVCACVRACVCVCALFVNIANPP